ncbi:MAG: hypothetical protein P1V51_07240 [Deltaproteobacteria bacterium]|nr:hypothetical protein [Deltaproteobacteria bacterium]
MTTALKQTFLTLCPLIALAVVPGCDDRSAEEKGRDYADEKIGFAEGAAKVLEEKGKGLGTSAAKGVGDLVKGAGSAVKDTVNPPVEVSLSEGLQSSGLKVLEAHEGATTPEAREVVVSLAFEQAYPGRLVLLALGEEGAEAARAATPANLEQAPGSQQVLTFGFPPDTRLSKIGGYRLEELAAKSVTVDAGLPADGLTLSQLEEKGSTVSLYAVFVKAYWGGLQLRAHDAGGQELGRSEPTVALKQAADSATYLSFDFDARTPLAKAARYTLHAAEPKPAAPTP